MSLCSRLAAELRERAATPLHLLIFGNCRSQTPVMDAFRRSFNNVECPVTWAEGTACDGHFIAGIQAHAFTGEVERLTFDGRISASIFTDGGARQCFIGGIGPADGLASQSWQTLQALENLQMVLADAGFELRDVVRTWFFLDDILSWYDDFNRARTSIYSGLKFRTGSLPASTGVGAANPSGTALTLAAWAFKPVDMNAYAEEVASPLQCPAPAYGSSFSRAMETSTSVGRRLVISGTASIAPGGKTLWDGDVRKQIETTMEVVEAILRSRSFALTDLTRATAYFRRVADAPVFAEWLAERRLFKLPVVSAQCDVCRDDLLFELEADAETQKS